MDRSSKGTKGKIMNNEFNVVLESINTTLRQTKIMHYPKQIQFSEEFSKALSKEVARHMQIIDESKQPIRDLPEKFLKALKFELTELTEKKINSAEQLKMKPRVKMGIDTSTKVHETKRGAYNRAKAKRDARDE
jgi:hypothetical protein